jgi:hypothetical protein
MNTWKRGLSRTGRFRATEALTFAEHLVQTSVRVRLMQTLRRGLQVHYLGEWVRARSDRVTIDRLVIALSATRTFGADSRLCRQ